MADDDRIIVEAARAVRYYLPGLVDHTAEIDTALVTLLERDRSGEDVVDVRKTLAVQGNRRVAPQGAQTRDRLGAQPERASEIDAVAVPLVSVSQRRRKVACIARPVRVTTGRRDVRLAEPLDCLVQSLWVIRSSPGSVDPRRTPQTPEHGDLGRVEVREPRMAHCPVG